MKWFINSLSNNWYSTEIDYSNYILSEDLNKKGKDLKNKLSEVFER